MNKLIKILPNEIKFKIIQFVGVNHNFDIDEVYFYIEPQVFIIQSSHTICINLYIWFGVNPENDSGFYHVIYERPYNRFLERSFGNIAKKIVEKINKFRLESIDFKLGDITFAGTFGPIDKHKTLNGLRNFYRLSNVSLSYKTTNILDYLKELNLINNNIETLDNYINFNAIKKLRDILIEEIKKAMNEYKKIIKKNILKGPIIKNIKNDNCPDTIQNEENCKIYYSLCKKKSDNQKILELNMKNKLINEVKKN